VNIPVQLIAFLGPFLAVIIKDLNDYRSERSYWKAAVKADPIGAPDEPTLDWKSFGANVVVGVAWGMATSLGVNLQMPA